MSEIEIEPISFKKFMATYSVVIPLIQREYAQGRDNEAGEEIRKTFVPELIAVLTGEKAKMELDFIFGKIDCNGFIPLDGQQRLTTLLLLHWYFWQHETQWKFTYKSRRMANSFVRGLLSSDGYKINEKPSKWIGKQEWFFENWHTDPTVSGMLTMLDAIHEVVQSSKEEKKECDPKNLGKIKFFIQPIDGKLDPDNVYTKMNARGEPLTSWENIKALLDKKAKDFHLPYWTDNIDGNWLSCIEDYAGIEINELLPDSDEDKTLIDAISKINSAFQNIFDLAVCIDLATRKIDCNEKEEEKKRKEMEAQQEETKNKIIMFLGHKALLSDYDKTVTWHTFELATNLFNTLHTRKSIINDGWSLDRSKNKFWGPPVDPDTSLFSKEFLFKKDYTYRDCSRFYAISRLVGNNDSTAPRWIRVIWNIIENGSDINADNLPKVINLIDQLAPYSDNIIGHLAKNEIQSSFAKDQLKEERQKAKLLYGTHPGIEWDDCIQEAERFMRGRIRIALLPYQEEIKFDTIACRLKALNKLAEQWNDAVGQKDVKSLHLIVSKIMMAMPYWPIEHEFNLSTQEDSLRNLLHINEKELAISFLDYLAMEELPKRPEDILKANPAGWVHGDHKKVPWRRDWQSNLLWMMESEEEKTKVWGYTLKYHIASDYFFLFDKAYISSGAGAFPINDYRFDFIRDADLQARLEVFYELVGADCRGMRMNKTCAHETKVNGGKWLFFFPDNVALDFIKEDGIRSRRIIQFDDANDKSIFSQDKLKTNADKFFQKILLEIQRTEE